MGNDETYNGWANRETWSLMLHVNNDQGLSEAFREYAGTLTDREPWEQSDMIRDYAETYFTREGFVAEFGDAWPDALADIAREIGSLWRIDWNAVRGALTED